MSEASVAVRWLLDQAEPEARRVAVQQIAKVRGREASELLLRALADDDWRVRKEATLVAPGLTHREEVVAALVAALEDTVNIGLRNAAVEALVAIGPDAVAPTVEAIGRFDPDARKLAVEVLGGIADARGIAALACSLSDEDANVRVAAAEALGHAALAGEESRDRATRALVDVLGTSNTFLRLAALDSLAHLEARLPWAVFEPFVADPLLRRYAIAAAGRSREPPAVRALAAAVGDPSPTIARDALVALGDLLADAADDAALASCVGEEIEPFGHGNARRAARDGEDPRARGGALLVLGVLGDASDVPALVDALGDDEVAERADMALRRFGPDGLRPMLLAAREARSSVHAAALTLAVSLEGANPDHLRVALREGLRSDSVDVLACAVEALGVVGEASDLRRVVKLVWHADERVAAGATNAVTDLAARHIAAARALLRDARSARDPVVLGCILLGAIATTEALGAEDVRLLERALTHDDPHVRRAAIDALAQARAPAAAEIVVFALADEERDVKLAAIRALGRLGHCDPLVAVAADVTDPVLAGTALRALTDADPERAMTAARRLVSHDNPAVACAAVEAIGQFDPTRTPVGPGHALAREEALFAALDHHDAEVVKLALSLIGHQPGAPAFARLGVCLDHPAWEVRRLAAELLGIDRSATAQSLLRVRYERENDPIVREAIALAVSVRPPGDLSRNDRTEPVAPQGSKAGG